MLKFKRQEGGGGGVPAGAISEVDAVNLPGLYKIAGNATDSNTLGSIWCHAKDASSDPFDGEVAQIVPFNPRDAFLGLTNLPVNVAQWNGTNVVSTVPPDAIFIHNGTATGGGASSITMDAGASATDNLYPPGRDYGFSCPVRPALRVRVGANQCGARR